MNHKGTRKIETARLQLRPFTIEDAEAMYRNWASDKDVIRYLTWPAHECTAVSESILNQWTRNYLNKGYYQWAIVLKEESDELVGSIGVNNEIDDVIGMAHMGYCIGKKWWHKGITSEALSGVMGFLFNEVGVKRIESRHDPRNFNSGEVMKKCGMTYEGTLRQSDWNNQGICDACYYACLADEWKRGK